MIPFTIPFLPSQEDYQHYLSGIWKRNSLTNNGPLVIELENKLKEFLRLKQLLFLTNGTIALQIAIKALGLKGEIITTPFSYVATSSSIVWEGCKPVFVDIDYNTFNINVRKIETSITKKTSAILATHIFGNPCDVEAIDEIAKKYRLKVIYDGAHSFATTYKSKSIFEWGDISTTSFHATKLFHTIEGGAVISNNKKLIKKISFIRNFGHNGPGKFAELGINGKNSEFHAAMGLSILPKISEIISKRKTISKIYDNELITLELKKQVISKDTVYNYSYYPLLFPSEEILLKTENSLNKKEIFPRRYFYPSLNTIPFLGKTNMPVTEDISKRILCLPMYHDLSFSNIYRINSIIKSNLNYF